MADVRNREWLDVMRYNKYPFDDTATMVSTDNVTIPISAFLDLCLRTNSTDRNIYLKSIVRTSSGYFLHVSDSNGELAVSESFAAPTGVNPTSIRLFDSQDILCGIFICDGLGLAALCSRVETSLEFNSSATKFTARTILHENIDAFKGFVVDQNYVSGRVWVVCENGIQASVGTSDIKLNAIGEPLPDRILYPDQPAPIFLQKINGQEVNGNDYYLIVSTAAVDDPPLRMEMMDDGIKISFLTPRTG